MYTIDGLAGYRTAVIGYGVEDGFTILATVSSVVTDTEEELHAEVASILADEDYAGWTLLWTLDYPPTEDTFLWREVQDRGIVIRG